MKATYEFPKIKKDKPKPVFLNNEMLQSIRVEAKFSDEGMEITVVGRHERDRGVLVNPNTRIKMEESDAATG